MVLPNSLSSYYEKFLATGEEKCIDEEIPFEIPATWEWCRLGYIFSHCTGKALNGTNRKGNLYTYITCFFTYLLRIPSTESGTPNGGIIL